MKKIIKIRIVLWGTLCLVALWLLVKAVVPSGEITYIQNFKDDSYFIPKLTTAERVEKSDGSVKIVGDPVYFALRAPRSFDSAQLTLRYKNLSGLPVMEAGVLADKTVWRYDLEPLENQIIGQLAESWHTISSHGLVLLQREHQFNSVDEFLNDLPDLDRIALYNYDLKTNYILEDYEPSGAPGALSCNVSAALRGTHQFYTYIKDETLDFTFTILDLNKNQDSELVEVSLYFDSELIASQDLSDDGIETDSGEIKDDRELALKLANLPEGVYKIEIKANDDIVIKNICTAQSKLAVINKLWLYKDERQDIELFTDSRSLQATTIHPDSQQSIRAGANELIIDETYRQFSTEVKKATATDFLARIHLAKDGVVISGLGTFSFDFERHINPAIKRVDSHLDINADNIDFILARYHGIEQDGEWCLATAEFDLKAAYQEKGKYNIIISIPGLRADDDVDDYIVVDEIKIELKVKTLWEKIKEMISK